jgi:hypothetical protein
MDENTNIKNEESAYSWDKFTKRTFNYAFDNTITGKSKIAVSTPPT